MDSRNEHDAAVRVWLEDGVCRIAFTPGVQVSGELVEHIFRRRLQLMSHAGEKHRILVTGARVSGMDYRASQLSVSPRISATIVGCALIAESPAMRMIAAPFILMFRPRYPIRLCPDEAAARRWLAELPAC